PCQGWKHSGANFCRLWFAAKYDRLENGFHSVKIMTIVCPNCSARLQLNDAKTPAGNVTVRCPKCQKTVEAQSPGPSVDHSGIALGKSPATEHARFERAMAAPPFRLQPEAASADTSPAAASLGNVDDAARLLI